MNPVEQNKALLRAYDMYADAIFRHCYFRVFDRERARELMQDVFMRTWEYLAEGNVIDNMKAFLYRVANNLVIDESRRKKASSLDDLQEKGFDIAGDDGLGLQKAAEIREVVRLIRGLPPDHREAMLLRYVDDLLPREIASALGISENAVSVRIHRGLLKLRRRMDAREA